MEISNSSLAAAYLRHKIKNDDAEEFWGIALNSVCEVITAQLLFKGTVNSCHVHPRDIFRFALLANAVSVVVGHNHPSGTSLPSGLDVEISKNLKEAGALLQIPVLDHVIITRTGHYSFADRKWKDCYLEKFKKRELSH
jgi:DNA repair protein RadC